MNKQKTTKEILKQITYYRNLSNIYDSKHLSVKNNNFIRLLQWVLGIRTRPYAEQSPLMEEEDTKALRAEILLRRKLRMRI